MIAENLRKLTDSINKKCSECGRDPSEIRLIAVSKNFGTNDIMEAHKLGLNDFGENKAQELNVKFEELGDKVTWHFIGYLQKNKVKYAVRTAEYIHSVDSLSLASEINKRAEKSDKVQKILIEIKTSEEETKAGITEESEIFELASFCNEQKNLELKGLMTIAPYTDDKKIIRRSFRYLRELRDKLNKEGYNIAELSMGMTNDYEIAIEEGATMLRVGSAIFGERDYSKNWKEI